MNKRAIIILVIIILTIFTGILILDNLKNEKNNIKDKELSDIKENIINENTLNNDNTYNQFEQKNSITQEDIMKIYIKVGSRTLTATLEKNSSSDALIEKLKQGDIIIDMEDYSNFEKVGSLGFSLPRNDKQITTKPGDIILYLGNQISIYYDTNSWNFTKLGKLDNINQEELRQILGEANVTVTFSLNNQLY